MVGCSAPRVVSDVEYQLPPRSADSIMIYGSDAILPEGTYTIGKVKVVDGGLTKSSKCGFTQMLGLAVERTALSGGNGLMLTNHQSPDVVSTCHRFWGTMLRVPESAVTLDTRESMTYIEEELYDQEMARQMDQSDLEEAGRPDLYYPHNVFKLSIGPSFIYSRMDTPSGVYRDKMGLEYGLEFQHLWRSGFGLGASAYHFATSFDGGYDVDITYVGPLVSYSDFIDRYMRWRVDYEFGMGCGFYHERYGGYTARETDFAATMGVGLEYTVASGVALGLQLNWNTMYMKKPDGYHLDEDEFYGIKRWGLLAGMRFYF